MRDVYFIRPAGLVGPIKIGCSQRPRERMAELMCWSPIALELIGTLPRAGFRVENRIHTLLWAYHTHKEWFTPSEVVLETVTGLLDGSFPISALPEAVCKRDLRARGIDAARNAARYWADRQKEA